MVVECIDAPLCQECKRIFLGKRIQYPGIKVIAPRIGNDKLQIIDEDPDVWKNIKSAEWSKAVRGLEPEDAEKVVPMNPRFEAFQQMALEERFPVSLHRGVVLRLASSLCALNVGILELKGWKDNSQYIIR